MRRLLVIPLCASALAWPIVSYAQQPLIDAGQQAMIQHYNVLIEEQSAPDQEEAANRARRARTSTEVSDAETCDIDAMKARLRPEYERRAKTEGEEAAKAWLGEKGAEFGRHFREHC